MENGEVVVSGGEKGLVTAYFENPDPITINTTGLNGTQTITSTEHNLKTGDAIKYNAAEKVTVDTTDFNSTNTISIPTVLPIMIQLFTKKGVICQFQVWLMEQLILLKIELQIVFNYQQLPEEV